MSRNDKKYSVGYGKPPRGKPFAKGRSGNPSGRPKKPASENLPANMRNTILDALKHKVVVRDNGKTRELDARQAVVLAQIATALKGNPIAQRDLIQLAARCEVEANEEHWERYRFWVEYKRLHTAQITKGIAYDDLPHPDDVVLHDGGNVSFNGPISQNHKRAIDTVLRIRDAILLKILWDERQFDNDPDDRLASVFPWWIVLHLTDVHLPPHFRWTNDDLTLKIMRDATLSKKHLLEELYKAIDAAPETAFFLRMPPRSLRRIMTRAGCATVEEFSDYLFEKAKAEEMPE